MFQSRDEQTYTLQPALDQEVPLWLKKHADLWIQDPSVEAVVLFGSRTTGHADSSSDWDVAILHGKREPTRLLREKDLRSQAVDLPVLPLQSYLDQAHRVGSLAHEIAVHGKVLAGSVPPTSAKGWELSDADLSRHLQCSFRNLAIAITDFYDVWKHAGSTRNPLSSIPGRTAVVPSVDGAKWVFRALCVHLGKPVIRTHDVQQLADCAPAKLQDKILAMKGKLREGHQTTYLENPETLADVDQRISNSLRLLTQIIEPCCNQLSDSTLASLHDRVHNQTFVLAVGNYLVDQDIHPSVRSVSRCFNSSREILQREQMKRVDP